MSKKRYIIVLVIMGLILTACDSSQDIQNKSEADINMENINLISLREFNEEMNMSNMDALLSAIRDYPIECRKFGFVFRDEYDNFVITEMIMNDEDEDEDKGFTAYYRLKNNKKEDDYDAIIDIAFYKTKLDNHEVMRNSLNEYAAMEVFTSALSIGDLAIGNSTGVNFIRGNVFVTVIGYEEVEIDGLAREIDQQILDILNENHDVKR
jgi:hypothetical protein